MQVQMELVFPVCQYSSVAVAGQSWLRTEPKRKKGKWHNVGSGLSQRGRLWTDVTCGS